MKREDGNEQIQVMSGTQDWYDKAGRNPLAEPGFTPQLMAKIEQAAEERSSGKRSLRFGRIAGLGGLAAVLLFGVLLWPFGQWGNSNPMGQLAAIFNQSSGAAAVQPSASPAATSSSSPQSYNPPIGSAEFEIGGMKYYMPLPLNRNKGLARAVETNAGIVWSPPPPMVNYSKPKYTHPTEPYTLYLSPKGQPELSEATSKRIYSFPLYAGGSQTYYELGILIGAGDYLIFSSSSYSIGEERSYSKGKDFLLDMTETATGKIPIPKDISVIEDFYSDIYKSFIAVNQEKEEMLFVYYTEDGKGNYTQHNKLYDIATGSVQVLSGKITIEDEERPSKLLYGEPALDSELPVAIVHYEVNGEQRSTEIGMKTGQQWFYDWWYEEYGVRIDSTSLEN